MNEKMTIKDVLVEVTKILNEINVPVSMVESIGIPVARAINGIQLCIDAAEAREKEESEKGEHDDA